MDQTLHDRFLVRMYEAPSCVFAFHRGLPVGTFASHVRLEQGWSLQVGMSMDLILPRRADVLTHVASIDAHAIIVPANEFEPLTVIKLSRVRLHHAATADLG